MADLKWIVRIISLAASAILLWTVITALSGENSIDADLASDMTRYGVDRVSGFYGPGSRGAWLLIVVACFLDRAFAEEDAKEDKHSHVLGLDINLVAAYAYLLIAAVDLLIHFRMYQSDLSSGDIGPFVASVLVVRAGASVEAVLAGFCQIS